MDREVTKSLILATLCVLDVHCTSLWIIYVAGEAGIQVFYLMDGLNGSDIYSF